MPSTDAGSRMSSGSSGPDRSVLPGTSKRAMTSPLAHLPYVLARPPHAARSKLSSPGVFLTLAAPPVADLPTPPRQGLAVHSCCPTHISVSSLVGISRSSPSHLRSVPAAETLLTSQIYRPAPEDRHGPPPSQRKYHIQTLTRSRRLAELRPAPRRVPLCTDPNVLATGFFSWLRCTCARACAQNALHVKGTGRRYAAVVGSLAEVWMLFPHLGGRCRWAGVEGAPRRGEGAPLFWLPILAGQKMMLRRGTCRSGQVLVRGWARRHEARNLERLEYAWRQLHFKLSSSHSASGEHWIS